MSVCSLAAQRKTAGCSPEPARGIHSFPRFLRVFCGFDRFSKVSPGYFVCNGFSRVLTVFHGFSGFSAVFSPGFLRFSLVFSGLPVFTGFYRFSPVSPGFYRFLLVVTGFSRFLALAQPTGSCGLRRAARRLLLAQALGCAAQPGRLSSFTLQAVACTGLGSAACSLRLRSLQAAVCAKARSLQLEPAQPAA